MKNQTTLLTIAEPLNEVLVFIDQIKQGKPITVNINNTKKREATTADLLGFIEDRVSFALCDLAKVQTDLQCLTGDEIE